MNTKKILMTGATGLIGTALAVRLIREGYDLVVLSRNAERARATFPVPAEFYAWNAEREPAPASAFEGVDAVVHLAGEPIAAGRWTAERKRRIYDSRILGSRHLVQTITKLEKKPRVLVSASAVGFYGDRGIEVLEETSGPGEDFLAGVCQAWENETARSLSLRAAGVRAVSIRTGLVLSAKGGVLGEMLPLFRAGLGGPLGSGRQYMSWIHIDDLVELYVHALKDEKMKGVVNGVTPYPVTNAEFSRVLAATLHRPCFLRAPSFALKLALGEMSTAILGGQNVAPIRALEHGFKYSHEALADALHSLLIADAAGRRGSDGEKRRA